MILLTVIRLYRHFGMEKSLSFSMSSFLYVTTYAVLERLVSSSIRFGKEIELTFELSSLLLFNT